MPFGRVVENNHELARGHGSALGLQLIRVVQGHCRVQTVGNINCDATGFDMTTD
jgi:hypothetical protein